MTFHPADPVIPAREIVQAAGGLEKALRVLSVLAMLMTVPQVLAVWTAPRVSGVSLISWLFYLLSACLWLGYGIRKHDKTIYFACVGWILLDAAIVLGVLLHR